MDNKEKHYFKLHVDHSKDHSKDGSPKNKGKKDHKGEKEDKPPKKERTFKDIFKDATRQIVASAIILIIGVVVLNWSSYSKIALNEWQKFFGEEQSNPLQELVEEAPKQIDQIVLKTSQNPEVQKKQIPPLDLEISPSDNRLIIPRINENIPVVRISSEALVRRDWGALEAEMQLALKNGVVHYPGTSLPGQSGNVAITGHSSYFPWDSGRFKDVFALLHDVVVGDNIVMYWDQQKYVYEIEEIKVVLPEDIEVLKQTPDERLTLITCTPVGTNLKRLIIIARPVDVVETAKVLR